MILDYKTFMRHAEKVTKTANERKPDKPEIHGVYHHPDGSLIVTDAIRLYKVFGINHDNKSDSIYTPKGKKIDAAYPNVDRLIPTQVPLQELTIEVGELLQAMDILYSAGSLVTDPVIVDFKDDEVRFTSMEMKGFYILPVKFEKPISLNALYLLEALKLFKAAKCKLVRVQYFGRLRPLVLKDESGDLTALILPVRKY